MNIINVIQQESKRYLNHVALCEASASLTYEQLFELVKESAENLKAQEIKKHARVALLCPEGIDYIVLVLAILSMDAVAIPIPFNSSKKEIKRILEEMEIECFVFDEMLYIVDEKPATFFISR